MTLDDWLVLLLVLCLGWLCFAGSAAALHWYLRVLYPPTRIVVVRRERSEEATTGAGDGVLSPAGLLVGLPPGEC